MGSDDLKFVKKIFIDVNFLVYFCVLVGSDEVDEFNNVGMFGMLVGILDIVMFVLNYEVC